MAGKAVPAVGSEFKLAADFGTGPGSLAAGLVVTVSGVHEPGTPGFGMSAEMLVAVDFVDVDRSPRTLALPLSEFTARFEKVN